MWYYLMKYEFFLKCHVKGREAMNRYLGPVRRLFLKNSNFTIISNNCWAGHVYRYFKLGYNTPTIGLYLHAGDYIKFCKNLKHYIDKSPEMTFITFEDSRYKEDLIAHNNIHCPIGVIDDIEIVFLHYKNNQEAYDKWNRRCKRIIWDNLYFKFSEQNLCDIEHLKQFDQLPFSPKVVFTSKDYGLESQVIFKEYIGQIGGVTNDTQLFRKYINLIRFINKKTFKQRQ